MKRLISISIMVSVLAVAGVASAYPITIQATGVNDWTAVNATMTVGSTSRTTNFAAGFFQLKIDGADAVNGFSVDPVKASGLILGYDQQEIVAGSDYAKAAYLFSLSNPGNAAAVQVAIWETVLKSDFIWNIQDAGLVSQVNGLLGQLKNADLSTFDLSKYAILSNGGYGAGYQDYIIDPPSQTAPVPEPATMLLLGSGFVGLAAFRKRFRK